MLRSIRFRLTLWFVAILALILGGFSLFIYMRQVQVLRSETASRLDAQAAQLEEYYRAALHAILEGEDAEGEEPLAPSFPMLQTSEMVALLGPDDQPIQLSANFPPDAVASIYHTWLGNRDPAEPLEFTSPVRESQHEQEIEQIGYVFVVRMMDLDGEARAILLLGSPLDPGEQLPRLAWTLAVVYGATLVVAFAGGYWLASRAMHPVQTITRTAREIGEHDLTRRLDLQREDELGQLAATFDQMLDRLQNAFERQQQFTGDASHELRTPLSVIELEASRTLQRNRTSREYQAALSIIQSESERMKRLVEELLALARIDSGKDGLPSESIQVSEIAALVVDRLAELARSRQVVLETGDLGQAEVMSDRTLLTYLLTNLVENGLKYAQGEGARVSVETGSQLRAGKEWAWLQVSDNGPGIPQEHLPHLFDRFYRVDAARTRSQDASEFEAAGSGLGLAIVQSIAQAFNGRVEVHSRVGEGTTFTVWLPAV